MVFSYENDDDAASDVSTESFSKGEKVLLDGQTRAQVAYFGPVHFSHDDDWIGIVLEEPAGKHSGNVSGHDYFKCDSMHGVFVRSHRLQRLDQMGHASARVKSPYRLRPKSSASMHELDEGEQSADLFARADQLDPLGYFQASAGTIRDELDGKLGRFVENEMTDSEGQVSYASPWVHSSRTPTPTHQQRFGTALSARRMPASFQSAATKKTPGHSIGSSRPYGITLGFGERDSGY